MYVIIFETPRPGEINVQVVNQAHPYPGRLMGLLGSIVGILIIHMTVNYDVECKSTRTF
jgi:hypothetical protein